MKRVFCDICDQEPRNPDNMRRLSIRGIVIEVCLECNKEIEAFVYSKCADKSFVLKSTNIGRAKE
jgi:RNase P subunit RPR2